MADVTAVPGSVARFINTGESDRLIPAGGIPDGTIGVGDTDGVTAFFEGVCEKTGYAT